MRATLRRAALSFLSGFVVFFLFYLFVRFSVDAVIIGAFGGAVTAAAVLYLFRRMAQDDASAPATPPGPRITPR